MKVKFNNADKKLNYSPKTKLKELVEFIFSNEKKELLFINYIFCSDEFLLKINQDFLQHDYYTDIITFPLSQKLKPVEAEIYISLDRIKQNAKENNTTSANELVRVVSHGALHLCGFKDKSKKDIQTMRGKEDFYIKHFNVPRETLK